MLFKGKIMTQEQLITIDQQQYRLSDLSDHAQAQLNNLRFVDEQLQWRQGQLALAQTAKATYNRALADNLPSKKAAANKKKDVILIDDSKYNLDDFNDEAKNHLTNIRFAEQEIQRLSNQQALLYAARTQYAEALSSTLKNIQPVQA
ncbi:hypothetical protein V6U78_03470 [Marinospirillum sp. MEB164]|uniref:Uncharacterized protein n=1 Tax=Marinospirillum alkalitolerans TaxID=3123374 RepID=A0ABW8PUZ2_9GAMM